MTKNILTAAAFTLALAVPASAEPSVGFGLNGEGIDFGVGVGGVNTDDGALPVEDDEVPLG